MSEFLTQTARALKDRLADIEHQLAGIDQLQQEKRRIEHALTALGERTATSARAARSARQRATGIGERIVTFVREHGDATVDEIADGLGEARQLIQRNTQSLAGRARLHRTQRSNGRTAFTTAAPAPASPPPAAPDTTSGPDDTTAPQADAAHSDDKPATVRRPRSTSARSSARRKPRSATAPTARKQPTRARSADSTSMSPEATQPTSESPAADDANE